MKGWIEKNIDPPGNERENWGAIFSFIGRVFGIVKDDAVKAHNAFFPYLADPEKLEEHAVSLKIPRLPYDSTEEFRERVTTASFYLMQAGERAYIHEQLRARFGDTYILKEAFLQVFIRITDLTHADRVWVHAFLDGILDPSISLSVAEWFDYVETIVVGDDQCIVIHTNDTETFINTKNSLRYNGRVLYDGHTVFDTETRRGRYDGSAPHDGAAKTGPYRVPAKGTIRMPPRYGSGRFDELAAVCKAGLADRLFMSDAAEAGARLHHWYNGRYAADGTIAHNTGILVPWE